MERSKRSIVIACAAGAACFALACQSEEPADDTGSGGAAAPPSMPGGAGAAPVAGAAGVTPAAGSGAGASMNVGGMTGTAGTLPLGGGAGGMSGGGGAGAGGAGAGAGAAGAGGATAGVVPSEGCGKPLGALTTGTHTIMSSGMPREYTIDVPSSYDPEHPYRLVFAWHWINASDEAVVDGQVSNGGPVWAYYGLKNQADKRGEPAIFIAPQSRDGRWDEQDHVLFDDLSALAKSELCIDTARVFATGFSFGAMITYSLSTNHQQQLRAVSALAPANFNIYLPTNTHQPIAYMSTTGMSDDLCYWEGDGERGAKFAAIGHAEDNGCTIPADVPTTTVGSKTYLCYDFEGCQAGYPVKACTFDGGHIAAHADGTDGDNGTTTWIPEVTWDFFTQF
jgi:poly(3-hydroxybutyrate) depolymerase